MFFQNLFVCSKARDVFILSSFIIISYCLLITVAYPCYEGGFFT
ncbi:putative membrane protein [Anaplasma phagocytophilum str. NCH-1]|uniref:Putative membrane protein n=1 Tax=Anaplasma phagocytophilum str. NCH-1 TaxID=1359161 RepID=A0A0F3N578_ANAPH|nr:putative membrane protein [Anaplasma phagocytophilum str. NCH-1]